MSKSYCDCSDGGDTPLYEWAEPGVRRVLQAQSEREGPGCNLPPTPGRHSCYEEVQCRCYRALATSAVLQDVAPPAQAKL